MNIRFKLTTIAIALLNFINSELTINSPIQWKAGNTEKITWSYTPDSALTATSFNLDLVTGDSNNLQLVQNLGQNIDPRIGSLSVVVPSSVVSGNSYALKATAKTPTGLAFRFSGRFAVANDGKSTISQPTSKAPTSSAPSSTTTSPSSTITDSTNFTPPAAIDNTTVGNTTENNSTGHANGSAYNYQNPAYIFGTSVLASFLLILA